MNTGSLISSSNARPPPGISLQRNKTEPFETKWLNWLGPWSFATFMDWLDDDREIEDTLLFGARFTFRPLRGLEIGLSRTAQWCGQGRPCDLGTFWNMLIGNDNSGVNVNPEDEPGNQLAGIDLRWSLPRKLPATLYLQWVGEDGRGGSALPGSWLRSGGVEIFSMIKGLRQSTYIEVAETACHDGGVGGAEVQPNCAYNHNIYKTGYRYRSRVMGYGTDGDSLTYALGSTLVQSSGHNWNVLLRFMEINRYGSPDPRHSISSMPLDVSDFQVSHERITRIGTFRVGLGYARQEDKKSGATSNDVSAFL